ncbi:MAG: glycine cleavage system protein GcvH [Pseudomonadota bacterium]|jgi:glycine cleavage system H protein
MEFPNDYKYTKDHEWVRMEGDVAVVGITEFAQSELGDLVFVDLPKIGTAVKQHGTMCVVESTKAASDVYSPLTGTVSGINEALSADPGLINRNPYSEGWIVKISGVVAAELAGLMSADEYKKLLGK